MSAKNLHRRKKRDHDEEHSHPLAHDESNWLVSYADMMTLLFGFFVLMYSMSRFDSSKFELISKELAKTFGGNIKTVSSLVLAEQKIKQLLKGSGDMNGVEIQKGEDNNIILNFNGDLLFAPGAVEINETAKQTLSRAIGAVKTVSDVDKIIVEGHTDIDQISSGLIKSNWELSALRAGSVVRYFEASGFDSKALSAVGLGSSQPLVPHADKEGKIIEENKSKNRRVKVSVQLKDPEAAFKLKEKEFEKALSAKEIADAEKRNQLEDRMRQAKHKLEEAQRKVKAAQEESKRKAALEKLERQIQSLEQKAQTFEQKLEEAKK